MPVNEWIGNAAVRRHVVRLTPGGTITAGDRFGVSIGGVVVGYTAEASPSATTVSAGLYAALVASTAPQFSELTYANAGTYVTVTGRDDGRPISLEFFVHSGAYAVEFDGIVNYTDPTVTVSSTNGMPSIVVDNNGDGVSASEAWTFNFGSATSGTLTIAGDNTRSFTVDGLSSPTGFLAAMMAISGDSGGTVTATGCASTSTASDDVSPTGPHHVDDPANWSLGRLPIAGDSLLFAAPGNVLYSLGALAGVALAAVDVRAQFLQQSKIGLPVSTDAGYRETLGRYFEFLSASSGVSIGGGQGVPQASLLRFRAVSGATATPLTVYATGRTLEVGSPALDWRCGITASHEVYRGSVGFGYYGDAAYSTPRIGYTDQQGTDAEVTFGTGTTIAAYVQSGGDVEINTAPTSITLYGGDLTTRGTSSTASATIDKGTLHHCATGTFGATTIVIGSGGTLDLTQDLSAKTIGSTIKMAAGATLDDRYGAGGNYSFAPQSCAIQDIKYLGPIGKTVSVA